MAALLFSLSFLFVTQANQADLIHALQTGTSLQQRKDALGQILQIPPAQRSEQLWLALADKLESESRLLHQKTEALATAVDPGTAPVVSDEREEDEVGAEYLRELAEAVGQWHDTRALPALVDAASLVDRNVFLQFGDAAVAPLVTGARQGHWYEQSTVLFNLQTLLEGRPAIPTPVSPLLGPVENPSLFAAIEPAQLSAQSKQQIRDLARDLLKPKAFRSELVVVTLPQVSNIALATGDPDLRRQVQALADLPSELSNTTGITDANKLLQVQNSIRAALAQHKQ